MKLDDLLWVLKTYDKILNHPVFAEINWLVEHLSKRSVCRLIQQAAMRNSLLYSSGNFLGSIESTKKRIDDLKKERGLLRRILSLEKNNDEESGKWKVIESNRLEALNMEIKAMEEAIGSMVKNEDTWLRQHFGEILFDLSIYLDSFSKARDDNPRLSKYAKELLDKKMEELKPLHKAVSLMEERLA